GWIQSWALDVVGDREAQLSASLVAAQVDRLDVELVGAVFEQRRTPGVGEVEAVEPGAAGAVLTSARRIDLAERLPGEERLAEVDRGVPWPDGSGTVADAPAKTRRCHR